MRRLFYAVIVAGALLWSPATAFACSGGPSAVNVYKECVPTGSGSKPTSGGGKSSGHASSTGTSQPTTVSHQTAKALKHTNKKERRRLAALLKAYGTNNRLPEPSSNSTGSSEPSAIGSAFDLGSGPTVLLIVLAATAVLLLAGSGVRIRRQRHRA
jgi:hypothetical protein